MGVELVIVWLMAKINHYQSEAKAYDSIVEMKETVFENI
jgi:hypothetical protein